MLGTYVFTFYIHCCNNSEGTLRDTWFFLAISKSPFFLNPQDILLLHANEKSVFSKVNVNSSSVGTILDPVIFPYSFELSTRIKTGNC